jgi:hypothetical protein
MQGLREYEGTRRFGKIMSWALTKGNIVVFLVLSINLDPFITTAYMRKGKHQFNGMSKRDWTIFMGSLLISNAYWTLACFMGITIVEWAWKAIKG